MNKYWTLGKIVRISALEEGIAFCRKTGLETLQLSVGDALNIDKSILPEVKAILKDFPAASIVTGWPGPSAWNFREGAVTLGFGPVEWRVFRYNSLIRAAEIASELEIPALQTHFGFVPENPCDPVYPEYVRYLKMIGRKCTQFGLQFNLETGQETPITLRRLIEDAGDPSVGINLDPANLLMYGKANPTDAMDIFGKYVKSLHIKDGCYPGADSYLLGEETAIGKGQVDFPAIFKKLRALNFDGPMIIEREVPEPQQTEDTLACIPMLKKWMEEA